MVAIKTIACAPKIQRAPFFLGYSPANPGPKSMPRPKSQSSAEKTWFHFRNPETPKAPRSPRKSGKGVALATPLRGLCQDRSPEEKAT